MFESPIMIIISVLLSCVGLFILKSIDDCNKKINTLQKLNAKLTDKCNFYAEYITLNSHQINQNNQSNYIDDSDNDDPQL